MLDSFGTLELEGEFDGIHGTGTVVTSRTLSTCDDDLNEFVDARDERVEALQGAVDWVTEKACDGCPDGRVTVQEFSLNEDSSWSCTEMEMDCDGTEDEFSGLCNCDLVDERECG